MLSTGEDIHKSFLYGIRKSHTTVVIPDKFVIIWNEWALKDWKNTHHFHDRAPELDKIIRDKLQNLIRRYYYASDNQYPWKFSLPDGVIKGYGPEVDPSTIVAGGTGGNTGSDTSPLVLPVVMEKYIRHLSAMFRFNYDTNTSQECDLTGWSDWLDATEIFNDDEGVLRNSYYLQPSDSRRYYKILDDKIYLSEHNGTKPYWILLEYLKDLNQMSYNGTEFSYDIDLSQEQLKEVIDSAVRIHIENLKSERYQTFLNEDKIRTQ